MNILTYKQNMERVKTGMKKYDAAFSAMENRLIEEARRVPPDLTVIEEYDPTVFARDLLADYIEAGKMS